MVKTLRKIIEEIFFNLIKNIYIKAIVNIMLLGKD